MAETPARLFNESPPADRSRRYPRILLILFLCTLPLVNPIVHGDGVGYYAYVRAPLIQHNLRFEEDWRHANLNFSQSRTMPNGELLPSQYSGNRIRQQPVYVLRLGEQSTRKSHWGSQLLISRQTGS